MHQFVIWMQVSPGVRGDISITTLSTPQDAKVAKAAMKVNFLIILFPTRYTRIAAA